MGVLDVSGTTPDVPMDVGSLVSLVRQDEVSAMEGTSCSSAAIEPMQGVVVMAEYENKRRRTVSGLLTIHEPQHVTAQCGASLG